MPKGADHAEAPARADAACRAHPADSRASHGRTAPSGGAGRFRRPCAAIDRDAIRPTRTSYFPLSRAAAGLDRLTTSINQSDRVETRGSDAAGRISIRLDVLGEF
jgi:hypothetical protein